jgi:hypothetical protein
MRLISLLFGFLCLSFAAHAQTCPVNSTPPSISGTPRVGQTLSVVPGTWMNNPVSLFHQWYRNASPPIPIPGETSLSHIASTVDVGFTLSVQEVVSNSSGAAQITSAPTSVVSSAGSGGIIATNLTNGLSIGSNPIITTNSISAAPNTVIVASIGAYTDNGPVSPPILSGAGQTWTLIGVATDGTARSVTMLYTVIGGSPTSGALTFSYPASVHNVAFSVNQFSGANLTKPIVKVVGAGPSTGAYAGMTLNLSSVASGDASYGFIRQNVGAFVSPGAGFTELSANNAPSAVVIGEAEFAINQPSVSWNWPIQSSDTVVGAAIEIAHQ